MKSMKKQVAILLIAVLLLSVLPSTVLAAMLSGNSEPSAVQEGKNEMSDREEESSKVQFRGWASVPIATVDPSNGSTTEQEKKPKEDGTPDMEMPEEPAGETGPFYTLGDFGVRIAGESVPVVLSANSDIMTASLLPLKEYSGSLDLSTYMPEDLANVKLETVWGEQDDNATPFPSDVKIMWAKEGTENFHLLGDDGIMDLRPTSYYDSTMRLELIVGTNASDQLDSSSVRYIITVTLPHLDDLFAFELYETGTENRLDILRSDRYLSTLSRCSLSLYVKHDYEAETVDLGYVFDDENNKGVALQALYQGDAETGNDISGEKTVISLGQQNVFTAVLTKDERTYTAEVIVYVYRASVFVDYNHLNDENGTWVSYQTEVTGYGTDVETYTVMLDGGFAANGQYYAQLSADNYGDPSMADVDCIERAVVGHYTSLDEAESQEDIKEQLFGSDSYGYLADYSKGVEFSVFTIFGETYHLVIKTTEYEAEKAVASTSTFFRVSGVRKAASEGSSYSPSYSSYIISTTENDSMGNIYQTILLLDNGNPVTAETIYPVFYNTTGVNVYLGLDKTSGVKQESGVSPVPFTPGVPVQYSAASESGTHLQNYYVTFITPQKSTGDLFVLGANAEDQNYDEEEGIPGRVIHLGDMENPGSTYYDIMFANVGQQELTGLYVKLENAENVKLDAYWTVTDNSVKKLAGFTTTRSQDSEGKYVSNGELPNLAKVRLVPEYDEDGQIKHGTISGYLVIGADGVDEIKIKLTGISGKPKIVTEELVEGTKYVPYDSLIQTNNVGEPDAVMFTLASSQSSSDASLPDGVTLYPDGELYGVPQETGTYTFSVILQSSDGRQVLDRAEFEVEIKDNTDDNVWNESDDGYQVLNAVGTEVTEVHYILDQYTDRVFRSNGDYGYYVDFYLDGAKLTDGTEYLSEEGSTVITILAETLENAGTGTHTIAAEFHEKETDDGTPDGSLKRTAQNYTVDLKPATTATPQPTSVPSRPTPDYTPRPSMPGDSGNAGGTSSNTGTNGNGTATNGNGVGNDNSDVQSSTVTCEMQISSASDEPLSGISLELHSTPQTASTNASGTASFSGVEFGNHTLYVITEDGSNPSFSFTLAQERSEEDSENTIVTAPGSVVKLNFQLDGQKLTLVSTDTTGPATGDTRPLGVYFVLLALSAVAMGILCINRKSKN